LLRGALLDEGARLCTTDGLMRTGCELLPVGPVGRGVFALLLLPPKRCQLPDWVADTGADV